MGLTCDAPFAEAQRQHRAEVLADAERTAPPTDPNVPPDAVASPDETNAPTTRAPFDAGKIVRATWAEAFPDATQEEIDAVIKEAFAESPPAAFTPPIGATSRPPG